MNELPFNPNQKTIAFCTVIIAAVCTVLWNKIFFIFPLIILLILFGFWKKYYSKIFGIVLLVFFILSIFYTEIRKPIGDVLMLYNKQNVLLEGKIISLPEKTNCNKIRFDFEAYKLIDKNNTEKEIKAKTKVFLDEKITEKIYRGNNLKLHAFIIIPETFSNPGEFDYGKYLANSHIFTLAFADSLEIINTKSHFYDKFLKYVDKIRENIITKHKKYLNQNKTEILGGIVFGSEAIKPSLELKTNFINSGLYHLLAASGMNVAFIFGIWFFILINLKIPYKITIISGGIIVFFYALMTGLPPSVTRATWMLELALLGKLLNRNSNNNTILFIVCTILLIYNPLLLNDIGFLLSFMVTFGLINYTLPTMQIIKWLPPKISGWFVIPFIAQIFAAPIQMYYFQTFSVYSILANMLVVPFMAIISFCGFISSIFALLPIIGSWICLGLDKLNEPFLTFMIFVAQFFSTLPNNIIRVTKLHFIEIVLYYLLIFLFLYMLKCKFKNIRINIVTGLLAIIILFCFNLKSLANDLTFTFLNVGEADSIFIKTPNDKRILVDTGKNYGKVRNSGGSIIVPFLKVNGINYIDLLILTHPDSDHIGGTVDVLENIMVKKIITNGEKAKNKAFLRLQNYLNTKEETEYKITKAEEISPDEDISIIAFKPPDTNPRSQNDTSIILIFKYKEFDAILMGDNEKNSYDMLKAHLNPTGEIELFKVGHHGSYNSVDEKMAKLVAPSVSVISVGENQYGHPHPKALSCLRGSRIYRTDMDNTVKIKTNGKEFEVYTYDPKTSCWRKDNRKP